MNIELLKRIAKDDLILWILFSKLSKSHAKYFDVRNCCLPMTISKTINKYGNDEVVNYYTARNPELRLNTRTLHKNIEVYFYPPPSGGDGFGIAWTVITGNFRNISIYLKGINYICVMKTYHKDSLFHNDSGPAAITKTLRDNEITITHEWYRKGRMHNKNGPAKIKVSNIYGIKYQKWYEKGRLIKTIRNSDDKK